MKPVIRKLFTARAYIPLTIMSPAPSITSNPLLRLLSQMDLLFYLLSFLSSKDAGSVRLVLHPERAKDSWV
jgi:hypothetical protein